MLMFMFALFYSFFSLNLFASSAVEDSPYVNSQGLTKIYVRGDQYIYTKDIVLPSGETAYFACEPIVDEDRSNRWNMYRNLTDRMVQFYFSPSLVMAKNGRLDSVIDQIFTATKVNQEAFLHYVQKIVDKDKMNRAITSIKSGCVGMSCAEGSHITYVSKNPVLGLFPLPHCTDEAKKMDFDMYINSYKDLVISVSSYAFGDINKTNLYEHRGIFRNPWSMICKDYPGLGLLVHVFTAESRSIISPLVRIMGVKPDGNILMRMLLMNEFDPEEMTIKNLFSNNINGLSEGETEKYYSYVKKFIDNTQGPTLYDWVKEQYNWDILISVNALKSRFPQ